jgi:UDP-2-acetamido-3-amino-2,3-dideoxy-glucuronate N-acetyltransferase
MNYELRTTNSFKIAILGAGKWGKNHVRVFCELLGNENVIVCDPDAGRREAIKAAHPGVSLSSTPVLSDVDAVVIATPAVTHFDLAREALLAGRHVLVEKPITLTSREAKELVDIAKRKERILMVDHLLEYHPAIRKLKDLADQGEMGRVLHLTSERLNLGVIRSEENALWSLAPHDISVILYLLGEEPVEVTAHGAAYLQRGIEDVCYLTMRFASGALGHVHVSWLDPIKTRRLSVVGKRKMAVYDDMQKEKLILLDQRAERVEGTFRPNRGEAEPVSIASGEPLRKMAETFIESVRTGVAPISDGLDGLRVVRVLEAAQRSMEKGGKPVQIKDSWVEGVFVHESACVDDGVKIGKGTKVWHFSHVMKGTVIGENCSLGQNVLVGPNAKVGNNVKIQNNVSVYEGVTLEDDVFCGPSMVFTNVDRPRSGFPTGHEAYRKTVIKKGASIGANATIVCGHTLGEHSFVGAGAVVTKDVPAYAVVYGNPARIHGWVCQCGEQLEFSGDEAVCEACERKYRKEEGIVRSA